MFAFETNTTHTIYLYPGGCIVRLPTCLLLKTMKTWITSVYLDHRLDHVSSYSLCFCYGYAIMLLFEATCILFIVR